MKPLLATKAAKRSRAGKGGRYVRPHRPTTSKARFDFEPNGKIVPMPKQTEVAEPTLVPRDADADVIHPVTEERGAYDGNTAFNLYLREVGQTKLLTIEEENELAARIKKGDRKARERMIKANLRLVVKIAREYEDYGMPLLDLINEGNMGLMKAVERFDPAKGAKLSTYSAWWIKQAIKRALANQSKTIRLPVHVVDKLFHMRHATVKLHEVLGREPTDEELGAELGFSARKVAQLRTSAIRPASLEAPLGDDDSSRIADVVADEQADTPYEQLEVKTNSSMLRELVATLEPREAEILRYRFGLDGDSERTLEEVGLKFGVTRERIRQIQNTALLKLRKQIEKLETVKVAA
jgi:RNA polymerase primary sigma factor